MRYVLGKLDVSTPIYCAKSMVTYQVVRKPTVFEGLILKLSQEHQDQLGPYSLSQIAKLKMFFWSKLWIHYLIMICWKST